MYHLLVADVFYLDARVLEPSGVGFPVVPQGVAARGDHKGGRQKGEVGGEQGRDVRGSASPFCQARTWPSRPPYRGR